MLYQLLRLIMAIVTFLSSGSSSVSITPPPSVEDVQSEEGESLENGTVPENDPELPGTSEKPGSDPDTSTGNDNLGNSFSLAAIAIYDPSGMAACNGVTLNPQWVLSAAHCFAADRSLDSYTVFTDTRSSVEEIVPLDGVDLALVKLSGDFPAVGCTVLPSTPPSVGDNASVYVFRETGGIKEIQLTIDDTQYMADNPAAGLDKHPMISLVSTDNGELTRDGDSGAGVFISTVDGQPQVQGIVAGVGTKKDAVLAEDISGHTGSIYSVVGHCAAV